MTSYLVLGGSGFLGKHMMRILGSRGIGTYASKPFTGGIRFDAPQNQLSDVAGRLPNDLTHVFILHGAINPDLCAREPERTHAINVASTVALIKEIHSMGLTPVYMSTDYVFDGTRGNRTEDEPVSPTTNYGRQKAEVEAWLSQTGHPHLICRASKIVSGETDTHSVIGQWVMDIKAGKTLRCADDQIFSPAHADDVASAMIKLADGAHTGIFHVAGPRAYSRYELARLFVNNIKTVDANTRIDLSACKLAEIPFAESRPLDTSLSTIKLASTIAQPFLPMEVICRDVAQTHFG
jgi:dTDP-4-dehydrorhamnose reductase